MVILGLFVKYLHIVVQWCVEGRLLIFSKMSQGPILPLFANYQYICKTCHCQVALDMYVNNKIKICTTNWHWYKYLNLKQHSTQCLYQCLSVSIYSPAILSSYVYHMDVLNKCLHLTWNGQYWLTVKFTSLYIISSLQRIGMMLRYNTYFIYNDSSL